MICYAQVVAAQQIPDTKKQKQKLNQLDSKGRKTGMWLNKIQENRGNPAYTEIGSYYNGLKTGPWYKVNIEGDLVAIENFKKDYYDGEVKYFVKGQVTCIGLYRGLNPDVEVDTIMVEDPVTGIQQLVAVRADRGAVRHGTWRFYNETTGSIEKVEEYQVDSLIYEEYFPLSKADSLYYERRNQNLPHMNKRTDKSAKKPFSYINY
ncbi:MAG: hypothetical protein KDC07_09530 [Chitinophagaceae bacterium]|nr:hypothetical protein [Chitinophagaceae bacterium]MCB9046289.1 hypothetical protein [Chitinophagales bacterium]